MKKLIIALCFLIFITNSHLLVGCNNKDKDNNSQTNPPAPSHTCEANYNITYREANGILTIGYPCKTCNKIFDPQSEITADFVIKTTDYNINSILSAVKPGDVIVYKSGKHSSDLQVSLNEITIYGETGTILNGLKCGNLTNTKIENIEFESHTELKTDVNGLSFKNCKFSFGVLCESPIKNISFDRCEFIDITSSKETAIRLYNYDNLTVKNCVFENIAYNAMQVGKGKGNCQIYGNTFKDIKSRIIYLIEIDNLSSCVIENNIFYDHHQNYVPDESYDDMGCKKETGVYIYTKSSSGVINIGINTWENIPEYSIEFITPLAVYNYNEQIKLI
ncbi:MAG: hypothetical protein E7373_00990 [Clostridiales bacterium]|nr:hypothetical protein [Clostridiales bacterium]